MLKIGICEDDKKTLEQLHSVISKILFQYTDMEIQHFSDGEEVLEKIKQGNFRLDLLFLDIHMKRLDGMKTAEFIRKYEIDVDIIFVTVSKEHVFEAYRYKAFAYCLKPIDEKNFSIDLMRYIEERDKCSDCMSINVKGKEQWILLSKVIYFESEKRKVIAHMLTDEVSFYAKMNEVEELVGSKGFIRCHQSYMVNRNMIESIGRTEIVVQGFHIPMSRKYYENIGRNMKEAVSVQVTHSLALNQGKIGAIIFVKGKLVGAIIKIRSGKIINLGRDSSVSDIVINDSKISRKHCSITYSSKTGFYTICDFSKNGLYTQEGKRLPKEQPIQVNAGAEIWLGSEENIFRLG